MQSFYQNNDNTNTYKINNKKKVTNQINNNVNDSKNFHIYDFVYIDWWFLLTNAENETRRDWERWLFSD